MTKLSSTCLYMDDRADDIFRSFKYTERETKTYDTVKRKLHEHFVLQGSSIFKHALLNSRRQEPGELVEEFIIALHTLIEHWEYGTQCDRVIWDRIVVVIVNAKLSEKQHLDQDLTLENAVTRVWQEETVEQPTPLRSATKDPPVLHNTKEGIYLETRRTHSRQDTSWPQLRHIINLSCQHVPGETNHPSMTDSSVQQKQNVESVRKYQTVCRSIAQVATVQKTQANPFLCVLTGSSRNRWNVTL